jgi:MraZ protein
VYFYGTIEHAIDERGRVAVPAMYRRALQDGGVLLPGQDGCVELYTHEAFQEETERRLGSNGTRLRSDRRRRRGFLPRAWPVELDGQGRIVVPQEMRDHAVLERRVTVVGCGDYVELWEPGRWQAEEESAMDEAEVEA